jgi:two-component system response regulator HydG
MGDEPKGKVLIVDDEPTALKVLSAILETENYQVLQAGSVDHAIRVLQADIVDTIITDMKMPNKTGLELFRYVQKHHHFIPVIFLTAYGTIEAAVNMMDAGAFHYFVKPPDFTDLKKVLAKAVEQCKLKRKIIRLKKESEKVYQSLFLIGGSSEMKRIYETIQSVKNSTCSVLVSGETGTGKELIARELHYSSNRSHKPFVAVNCAAIPHDLIEAELFGHEKGAFTGASQRRVGRIEAASGGTLFLDEIGELDTSVQSKLLRVLQEKEFSRLGDNLAIEVDFRLIASTNRDLRKEIGAGNFREDLFYRLNVVCINIPPLRDRRTDISLLARAFVEEFCEREEKALSLSSGALKALQKYSWPGNVRELKNVIEGAVVMAKSRKIKPEDFPAYLHDSSESAAHLEVTQTLKELEVATIRKALQQCEGNKTRAAKLLGVSRKTLYKRIEDGQIY